jgi:proteasome accessory factor B
VRARVWHASQETRDEADGRLRLTLNVCHDWALRSWILSWGPFARVLAPPALTERVGEELRAASERYNAPASSGTARARSSRVRSST